MQLTDGSCVCSKPKARSCFNASSAVNRVYARLVLNVGSCCECACANCHSACAASGCFCSQRLLPQRADWAPRQRRPLRLSANPSLTVSRPHPNRVSANLALPWHYLWAISAMNARRLAPTIFDAASFRSAIADSDIGDDNSMRFPLFSLSAGSYVACQYNSFRR